MIRTLVFSPVKMGLSQLFLSFAVVSVGNNISNIHFAINCNIVLF